MYRLREDCEKVLSTREIIKAGAPSSSNLDVSIFRVSLF